MRLLRGVLINRKKKKKKLSSSPSVFRVLLSCYSSSYGPSYSSSNSPLLLYPRDPLALTVSLLIRSSHGNSFSTFNVIFRTPKSFCDTTNVLSDFRPANLMSSLSSCKRFSLRRPRESDKSWKQLWPEGGNINKRVL